MKATQLELPFPKVKTELQTWKEENKYTVEDVALALNVSRTHAWNALKGRSELMPIGKHRLKKLKEYQRLIAGNPEDVRLLRKEYQEFLDGGFIK